MEFEIADSPPVLIMEFSIFFLILNEGYPYQHRKI